MIRTRKLYILSGLGLLVLFVLVFSCWDVGSDEEIRNHRINRARGIKVSISQRVESVSTAFETVLDILEEKNNSPEEMEIINSIRRQLLRKTGHVDRLLDDLDLLLNQLEEK